MGMSDGVREDGVVELIRGRWVHVFSLFSSAKNIALAALAILLLLSGTSWAAPGGQLRGGREMKAPVAWAQRGGFDRQRIGGQGKEHLPEWFRQHQNLPPQAQERALRNEPGFSRLPVAVQQRLLKRLQQLDAMPPFERERTLQRMEALERLSPEQREQVRNAMQQVTMMPPDRRRMMHDAFHELSQMNPEQRWAVLNSARFRAQYSNWERQMLSTLLSVQPYTVGPIQGPGLQYGRRR